MSDLFKRIAATVLMVGVVLGATMTLGVPKVGYEKIEDSETVMTIDGSEVSRDEFAYFLSSMYANLEAQGIPTSLMQEKETGSALVSYVFEQAVAQEKYWHTIVNEFHAQGGKLDRQLLEAAAMVKQNDIKNAGGRDAWLAVLEGGGLSEQMYDNSLAVTVYMQALQDTYYGENGVKLNTAEQKKFFEENFVACKHILFTMSDRVTGEGLSDAELEEKYTLAESVLAELAAGADFDALMNEHSEDVGGIKEFPDGYILHEDTTELTGFVEAAKAVEIGAHTDIIQTEMGWSIIQRVPLDPEKYVDYTDSIILLATGSSLNNEIQTLMDAAEVEYTEAYGDPSSYANLMSFIELDVPAAE